MQSNFFTHNQSLILLLKNKEVMLSNKKFLKYAGSMSVAVLISRFFGLGRDIMMTSFFGTTYIADAFQAGFQLPNLLRKMFGEGALSAAFIPVYKEIEVTKGRKKQIEFGINLLSILSVILFLLSLLGILMAPILLKILTPGFDIQTHNLAVKIARILFPYLFLIGFSSTLISILNSHGSFFVPGLSSSFLNIGMIGILSGYNVFNPNSSLEQKIIATSIGVLIGGIFQTLINFPQLRQIGYNFRLNISLKDPAMKVMWTRFLPGVIGLAVRQINLYIDLILASFLVSGSLAALQYGNRLMQFPMGIFGVAAGTAVLPLFSKYTAEKNWDELSKSLRFSILSLSFVMLPMTAIIASLGKDFIKILFMRGNFDVFALNMTYKALLFYSLGLIFYSINRIIIPVFYANKDTKTPVKISAYIVLINIFLNITLMKLMQHSGLALATSISAFIQMVFLIVFLKKKVPKIQIINLKTSLLKISFLSTLLWIFLQSINHYWITENFFDTLLKSGVLLSLSVVIIFNGATLFNIENSKTIKDKFWKKLRKK